MTLAVASPRTRSIGRWVFTLTLIGYPIFGLLAALLNLDSIYTTTPFRLAVLVLSLVLAMQVAPRLPMPAGLAVLWMFLLAYLMRLLWDAAVAGVPGAPQALAFYVFTVLLPCGALGRSSLDGDELRLARLLFAVGGFTCTLAISMYFLDLGQARSLTEVTGRLAYEAVNPITLGHTAATTLIAGLCLIGTRPGVFRIIAMALAATASVGCMALTASRGPVVVLAACVGLYIAFTGRWRLFALLAVVAIPLLIGSATQLEARFTDIEHDESANERLMLQSSAFSGFTSNPFFGSAFAEPIMLTYPHNVVIETAMALGVAGLALLLYTMGSAGLRTFGLLRRGALLLPLIFVQYLLAAQLSGAIYGNAGLWASMILLFHASTRSRASAMAQPGSPVEDNDARPLSMKQST